MPPDPETAWAPLGQVIFFPTSMPAPDQLALHATSRYCVVPDVELEPFWRCTTLMAMLGSLSAILGLSALMAGSFHLVIAPEKSWPECNHRGQSRPQPRTSAGNAMVDGDSANCVGNLEHFNVLGCEELILVGSYRNVCAVEVAVRLEVGIFVAYKLFHANS